MVSVADVPADAEYCAVSDRDFVAVTEKESSGERDGCCVDETVIESVPGAENVDVSIAVLDVVGTFEAAVNVLIEDSVSVASAVVVTDTDEVEVGDDVLDAESVIFEEDVEEDVTEGLPLSELDAEVVVVAEFVVVALLECVACDVDVADEDVVGVVVLLELDVKHEVGVDEAEAEEDMDDLIESDAVDEPVPDVEVVDVGDTDDVTDCVELEETDAVAVSETVADGVLLDVAETVFEGEELNTAVFVAVDEVVDDTLAVADIDGLLEGVEVEHRDACDDAVALPLTVAVVVSVALDVEDGEPDVDNEKKVGADVGESSFDRTVPLGERDAAENDAAAEFDGEHVGVAETLLLTVDGAECVAVPLALHAALRWEVAELVGEGVVDDVIGAVALEHEDSVAVTDGVTVNVGGPDEGDDVVVDDFVCDTVVDAVVVRDRGAEGVAVADVVTVAE
jgi:hypothetical protein